VTFQLSLTATSLFPLTTTFSVFPFWAYNSQAEQGHVDLSLAVRRLYSTGNKIVTRIAQRDSGMSVDLIVSLRATLKISSIGK
jgi:prephenate dehydrogenase